MFKQCSRRIGVELEYNATDRLSRSNGQNNLPTGIYDFGQILLKTLKKNIDINKWHQTNNNENWIIKPDSSCGLEVCSPPAQPSLALIEISKVIEGLNKSNLVSSDIRCSLHLHVEIEDFDNHDIVSFVQNWINFEHFFFFVTKTNRWMNRYCKPLGFYYAFNGSNPVSVEKCVDILGDDKYFAINFYHYKKDKRKTIEFRIMGNDACKDIDDCVNWCKLILCFVEMCRVKNNKKDYVVDIVYKDIDLLFDFLELHNFFEDDNVGMWVISRLNDSLNLQSGLPAVWSDIMEYSRPGMQMLIEKIQRNFL